MRLVVRYIVPHACNIALRDIWRVGYDNVESAVEQPGEIAQCVALDQMQLRCVTL